MMHFTTEPDSCLSEIMSRLGDPKVLVVADSNTSQKCMPLFPSLAGVEKVVIEAGEEHKNISTLQEVWKGMMQNRLLRGDLIVNVGGGVVTDLGGLAAATYMRGIRYINLPTTLLADVDAASGGKTAIDFGGIKNLIGAFHSPVTTVIAPQPLHTLPRKEMLSGWGEMLKHALLDSEEHLERLLATDLFSVDDRELLNLIRDSAMVKQRITSQDPQEHGLRRVLNLGHTCGHALEALCMAKGVEMTHGQAVAFGILAELRLSPRFPQELYGRLSKHIQQLYSPVEIRESDMDELRNFLRSDKKNLNPAKDIIAFISMDSPGNPNLYAETEADTLCALIRDVANF